VDDPALYAMLSAAVRDRLMVGAGITPEELEEAFAFGPIWRRQLDELFGEVEILALASVGFFPPPLTEAFDHTYTHLTTPVNLAGYPAVSIPIPSGGPIPASLQLIGPPNSEELLLATAAHFEHVARG
jgi:amidase